MRNFVSTGRKIIAIGRNYLDHAKELNSAIPKAPFFFLKPTSSYLKSPNPILLPSGCDIHYEVELGVVIGKEGKDISALKAYEHVAGYALAIDMTARNMQNDAKNKGLPWSAAKGFDTFTPVGEFIPKEKITDPHNLKIWLKLNESIKQNGNTSDMMFKIPQLIELISSIMTLEKGDLILTGTPKGVGSVKNGDSISVGLECINGKVLNSLKFNAIAREGNFKYSAP